jgi:hypothetical protein
MELREFIKSSLIDILGGIQDAAAEIHANDEARGAVNPLRKEQIFSTQKVAFDIAVTAASEESKGAKGGVKVYVIDAGIDGKSTKSHSTASRLQFSIPVSLPAQVIDANS